MAEKPMIFNAEMVRAIQKGIKTQTRRVLRPQPVTPAAHVVIKKDKLVIYERGGKQPGAGDINATLSFPLLYGKKGDRLWVRETIIRREIGSAFSGATYKADLTPVIGVGPQGSYCNRAVIDWKWKRDILPSIFMPRWASRITLEITEVRAERLQQISYQDIRAEGIEEDLLDVEGNLRYRFKQLWDSINAKRGYSWQDNPWVWIIIFKVMPS